MKQLMNKKLAGTRFYQKIMSKVEKKKTKDKWKTGIEFELNHWRAFFVSKNPSDMEDLKNRLNPDSMLGGQRDYLPPDRKNLKILDIGSGPLTTLGKRLPGRNLTIVAADPLADEYNKLMDECGITPLIRPVSANVENLSTLFDPDTFDLVHMMNALDHSYDPIQGIRQMLRVVKKDCNILLIHRENEAEFENYSGFHQWNLSRDEEAFLIWNSSEKLNVSKMFKGIAEIEIKDLNRDAMGAIWNLVVIKKKKCHI